MSAQSIISRYNHMHHNQVSGATLREFHAQIQAHLDRSATGQFTKAINLIRGRVANAIKSVKKDEVVKVVIKPIDVTAIPVVKKSVKLADTPKERKPDEKPDPAKVKHQDIKTKRQTELDKKSKAGVTFKDLKGVPKKKRKKLPAKQLKGSDKIDLRKLRHYIDGYLQIEKQKRKIADSMPAYGGGYTADEVDAIHKKYDKLEDNLQIQVQGAAKALKISEIEFIDRVNDFTENGNSLKNQISGIKPKAKVKLALPKKRKQTSLNGVVDAAALSGINFHEIPLSENYKQKFVKLNSDTNVMVWGGPGSGKTVELLKFANDLATAGLKTLYISEEEFGKSTLASKILQFGIGHKNLSFTGDLDESQLKNYDAIFFDSVNSMGLTSKDMKRIDKQNPNKLLVMIVQVTKDGDFRGGKDWEHLVDVAGEVVNRQLILRKHRLDPDNQDKYNKLMFDDQLKKKKAARELNERVKAETKREQPNELVL